MAGILPTESPAADTAAALLVLDAQVKIASGENERTVPIADFYLGPGQTVLQAGEILTGFSMPPRSAKSGSQYLKHKIRQVMDLAFVGVATSVSLNNGTVADTKIGLAAVAPKPIRATERRGNHYRKIRKRQPIAASSGSSGSTVESYIGFAVHCRASERDSGSLNQGNRNDRCGTSTSIEKEPRKYEETSDKFYRQW